MFIRLRYLVLAIWCLSVVIGNIVILKDCLFLEINFGSFGPPYLRGKLLVLFVVNQQNVD